MTRATQGDGRAEAGAAGGAEGFKRLDAASYDPVADTFARIAETYTRPLARRLVELAALEPGDRVLDLGTGTGIVAREAGRPSAGDEGSRETPAKIVGIDLSEGMLRRARREAPPAAGDATPSYVRMDGERLAFPDRSFDVVVSLFAMRHLPSPAAALAEAHRVLHPGGRIVVGIGSGPPPRPAWALREGLEQLKLWWRRLRGEVLVAPGCLEEMLDPVPLAETPWSRRHPRRELLRQLRSAGLRPQRVDWLGRRATVSSPDEFWELAATFSSTARKTLAVASDAERAAIRRRFLADCRRVLDRGGRLVYPYAALFVMARRPDRRGAGAGADPTPRA